MLTNLWSWPNVKQARQADTKSSWQSLMNSPVPGLQRKIKKILKKSHRLRTARRESPSWMMRTPDLGAFGSHPDTWEEAPLLCIKAALPLCIKAAFEFIKRRVLFFFYSTRVHFPALEAISDASGGVAGVSTVTASGVTPSHSRASLSVLGGEGNGGRETGEGEGVKKKA